MRPWGTLRFEDVRASAPTGTLEASAEAVLRGFSVERVDGRVHVARGESIPISVEGVPLGRAYGDVKATAAASEDRRSLDVQVDVPTLRVDLPQATRHSVQKLDADRRSASASSPSAAWSPSRSPPPRSRARPPISPSTSW